MKHHRITLYVALAALATMLISATITWPRIGHRVLLASAARTVTPVVDALRPNRAVTGVYCVANATAITTTPIVTITAVLDYAGLLVTTGTLGVLDAVETVTFWIGSDIYGIGDTVDVINSAPMPDLITLLAVHTDTDSITYSIVCGHGP